MTVEVLNDLLIAAAVVCLAAAAIARTRRRRCEQERHLEERRLILEVLARRGSRASSPEEHETGESKTAPATAEGLDPETLSLLMEWLDQRPARRRGVLAGLLVSPVAAWQAGARAGQRAGELTRSSGNWPRRDQ